jgi:hypothetical protein
MARRPSYRVASRSVSRRNSGRDGTRTAAPEMVMGVEICGQVCPSRGCRPDLKMSGGSHTVLGASFSRCRILASSCATARSLTIMASAMRTSAGTTCGNPWRNGQRITVPQRSMVPLRCGRLPAALASLVSPNTTFCSRARYNSRCLLLQKSWSRSHRNGCQDEPPHYKHRFAIELLYTR